ncbi:helix-turn-helix domain-containing protein [Mammaliicoccus sciuri]|uniref:helix-turn-helix domain-containing protein n=1 Tax=Mammaliicoccus sciuri TaxID=1296 RepID=UPI0020A21FD5|nr:helix-turn-helix transcriptional regulator [Mammaliicoccus sciuri]MCP1286270.1 helix-turn-helix domain-containing protein [Mammaliicoccus sciuri]
MSNQHKKEILSHNLLLLTGNKTTTQAELAKKLNVTTGAISHWISKTNYPRDRRLHQMSDFFGISKSDLTETKIENA